MASGSPTASGVVLWTRLAPEPLALQGLDAGAIAVRWEVAHDEKFSRLAASGTASADPSRAHAVHVEVDGLQAARWYHYRFLAGDAVSAVGRTRTAPRAGHGAQGLRLALASCQHYEQGTFVAHRHLAAENPDLVAFVGDYIYESNRRSGRVREHAGPKPRSLAEYRLRYAQYRTDADLQAAHACAPWLMTWDDHEVDNDYAGDRDASLDPRFLERRAAAYRAYLENQPLRPSALRPDGEVRLYGSHGWGELATLHVLDGRQYRAPQVCARPGRGGSNIVGAACEERLAPGRTMLGAAQERWLAQALAGAKPAWHLIVQQTLMAPAAAASDEGPQFWTDGWDGYPWARARLLDALAASGAANPVFLGGDVHANFVADLHADPGNPRSPVLAAEFCGTSITSSGPSARRVAAMRQDNPHIRFADGSRRGYVRLDLTLERLEASLRVVDSVQDRDAGIATQAQFRVHAGRPGIATD